MAVFASKRSKAEIADISAIAFGIGTKCVGLLRCVRYRTISTTRCTSRLASNFGARKHAAKCKKVFHIAAAGNSRRRLPEKWDRRIPALGAGLQLF